MAEIREEVADRVLRLHLSGPDSIQNTQEVAAYVMEVRQRVEFDTVLVIDRTHGELSPADILDFEHLASKSGFPRDLKVAIVDLKTDRGYGDNRFMETVGLNRGWQNFRVFRDEESAMKWLEEV
jgi:hypothetical protein